MSLERTSAIPYNQYNYQTLSSYPDNVDIQISDSNCFYFDNTHSDWLKELASGLRKTRSNHMVVHGTIRRDAKKFGKTPNEVYMILYNGSKK